MAFIDDVNAKAAALTARASALEGAIAAAAVKAKNPPPQNEYDMATILADIAKLKTDVAEAQTTADNAATAASNAAAAATAAAETLVAHTHTVLDATGGVYPEDHPDEDLRGEPITVTRTTSSAGT